MTDLSKRAAEIHDTLKFLSHMFKQPEMEAMLRGQWSDPETAAAKVEEALKHMPDIVAEIEKQATLRQFRGRE